MNPEPKFSRQEFNEIMSWHTARLIESGEMPTHEKFLAAVGQARREYGRIRTAAQAAQLNFPWRKPYRSAPSILRAVYRDGVQLGFVIGEPLARGVEYAQWWRLPVESSVFMRAKSKSIPYLLRVAKQQRVPR